MTSRSGFSSRFQVASAPPDGSLVHQNESEIFLGTFLPQGSFQPVNASIRSQEQCRVPSPLKTYSNASLQKGDQHHVIDKKDPLKEERSPVTPFGTKTSKKI
jgi:hypothetical protein